MSKKKKLYYFGGDMLNPSGADEAMKNEEITQQSRNHLGAMMSLISLMGGGATGALGALSQFNMGGSLSILNGPSHEEGGIPIDQSGNPTAPNLASGEAEGMESVKRSPSQAPYVFSNAITNPRTGRDFFTDSKKFAPDKNDDAIAKRTKEMMLTRLQGEQEAEREKVLGKATKRFMKKYGGYLPDGDELKIGKTMFGAGSMMPTMYNLGGDLPGSVTDVRGLLNYLDHSFAEPETGGEFLQRNVGPIATPNPRPTTDDVGPLFGMGFYPQLGNETKTNPVTPESTQPLEALIQFDMSGDTKTKPGGGPSLVNQYAPYLGAAFNIGRGLSEREYYKAQPNTNQDRVRQLLEDSKDFDIADKRYDLVSSRNATDRSIRNTGGSRGGMVNRLLASQLGYDRGLLNLTSEASRFRSNAARGAAGVELQLGEGDRQENRFAADMKMRTDSNARNLVGEGLSQVGTNVQQQQNDRQMLNLLKILYGNYGPMQELLR